MAAPMSADSACGQIDNVDHQRRAIVGTSRLKRSRNKGACGILRSRAPTQDAGDGLVRQKPMHAIAAQEEAVMPCYRLGDVVQPYLRLDTERPAKDAPPAGAIVPNMVGGKAGKAVTA